MRSLPNMPTPWRVVVALVTAFLLISMGGQIAGAPLAVPALWWAARSSRSRAARAGFAVLAGMTMLFVGWFVPTWSLASAGHSSSRSRSRPS